MEGCCTKVASSRSPTSLPGQDATVNGRSYRFSGGRRRFSWRFCWSRLAFWRRVEGVSVPTDPLHEYLKSRDSGVAQALLEGAPGRLLDLGSGSGEDLQTLSLRGWDAIGLEPFQRVPGIRTVCGIAELLPFRDNSFDAVTCVLVLPHLESAAEALQETFRVLRRGGQALFVVFSKSPLNVRIAISNYRLSRTDGSVHTRLFSARALSPLVRSAGFNEVAQFRTDFLPWMSEHLFPKDSRKRVFVLLGNLDATLSRTPARLIARKLVLKAIRP